MREQRDAPPPLAVSVLCVLGSAAAASLAQPSQWTTAALYAAAAALAVSLFGIQQLYFTFSSLAR
jgi:hypothetical protein